MSIEASMESSLEQGKESDLYISVQVIPDKEEISAERFLICKRFGKFAFEQILLQKGPFLKHLDDGLRQAKNPVGLSAVGIKLFVALFPSSLQKLFGDVGEKFQTIIILSEEPWIPGKLA